MTATYRERPPVAGLAPAVACVWTQHVGTTSAPYEHRVVPDACVDVLWRDGRLELAGPDTGPVLTPLSPQSSIVGIRFRPGHARRFLGVPVSELTDARLSLDDVLGDDARDLADRLADARTADDGERLLEAAMLERVPTAPDADDVVEPLVAMLATGRSSVHDAARTLAFSERQLHRRCVAAFGYGPKTLDRVLRFQRFLRAARATDASFARLAAASGYSDEAHLAHECRALGGTRPSELAGRVVPGS